MSCNNEVPYSRSIQRKSTHDRCTREFVSSSRNIQILTLLIAIEDNNMYIVGKCYNKFRENITYIFILLTEHICLLH